MRIPWLHTQPGSTGRLLGRLSALAPPPPPPPPPSALCRGHHDRGRRLHSTVRATVPSSCPGKTPNLANRNSCCDGVHVGGTRRSLATVAAPTTPTDPAPVPSARAPATQRPASPPSTTTPITLRDYQEDCIRSVLSAIEAGHKRMGISLATGAGKTVIFTQLISRIPAPRPQATRTLVLAHRRELVEQAARHCSLAYPDATVEIEMGNLHASGAADITVASVQSITSRDRLDKYDADAFKLVLVDEAHHIVAPNYGRTLEHFGLATKRAGSPTLVGVSATFGRFDGVALGSAIDEIVYHKDYVDMIGDRWLSDVVFTTVETSADLSGVGNASSGDFQAADLSRAVNTNAVNEITVRTWLAKAHAAGRKSTLVFCVDVAHVVGLTNWFRQRHGIDARFVTGETAKVERAETLDAFRAGAFPVLVNCGVFTEGTDIPNIDCIVLGRPTRSRNLLVQMIGRGMRLHHAKTNCHIIDLVSSLETGIVTTPTLFGLDPNAMVDEASVDDMRAEVEERLERKREEAEQKKRDAAAAAAAYDRSGAESEQDKMDRARAAADDFDPSEMDNTRVTFTEYSSVLDLISDTSGERHIRAISPNAWVNVDRDRYVLCNSDGSYVRLEKTGAAPPSSPSSSSSSRNDSDAPAAAYVAVLVKAIPWPLRKKTGTPLSAPREILRAATFIDAVHGCDRFAASSFPHYFIARNQKWRDGPATQGQVDFLNKVRGQQDDDDRKKAKGKTSAAAATAAAAAAAATAATAATPATPTTAPVLLTTDSVTKGAAMDMITKIRHGARGRFAQHRTSQRRLETAQLRADKKRAKKDQETVRVGPLNA